MNDTTEAKIEELCNDVVQGGEQGCRVAYLEPDPKIVNAHPGPESKAIFLGNEAKGFAEAVLRDALRAKKPLARYRILIVVD